MLDVLHNAINVVNELYLLQLLHKSIIQKIYIKRDRPASGGRNVAENTILEMNESLSHDPIRIKMPILKTPVLKFTVMMSQVSPTAQRNRWSTRNHLGLSIIIGRKVTWN